MLKKVVNVLIIIFACLFVLALFSLFVVPHLFQIKNLAIASPNKELVVYHYTGADEGSIAPYGEYVFIKPSYKFWKTPNIDQSVFAGWCNAREIEWRSNTNLHITCHTRKEQDIVRQLNTWNSVNITYNITFNENK